MQKQNPKGFMNTVKALGKDSKIKLATNNQLMKMFKDQGVKPIPEKVLAILALMPPTNVKELRRFLGMVQYYRNIWEKRSHLLALLTNLVGECGHTKETNRKEMRRYV